jgi:hypothetical protein
MAALFRREAPLVRNGKEAGGSQGRCTCRGDLAPTGKRSQNRYSLFWDVTHRYLPTFRYNLSIPSATVELSSKRNYSRNAWPLKMGPKGCSETSVASCESTLRNISEERRFHLRRGQKPEITQRQVTQAITVYCTKYGHTVWAKCRVLVWSKSGRCIYFTRVLYSPPPPPAAGRGPTAAHSLGWMGYGVPKVRN